MITFIAVAIITYTIHQARKMKKALNRIDKIVDKYNK